MPARRSAAAKAVAWFQRADDDPLLSTPTEKQKRTFAPRGQGGSKAIPIAREHYDPPEHGVDEGAAPELPAAQNGVSASKWLGVHIDRKNKGKPWRVKLSHEGHHYFPDEGSYYRTEEEAARTYDALVRQLELVGQKALNFPRSGEPVMPVGYRARSARGPRRSRYAGVAFDARKDRKWLGVVQVREDGKARNVYTATCYRSKDAALARDDLVRKLGLVGVKLLNFPREGEGESAIIGSGDDDDGDDEDESNESDAVEEEDGEEEEEEEEGEEEEDEQQRRQQRRQQQQQQRQQRQLQRQQRQQWQQRPQWQRQDEGADGADEEYGEVDEYALTEEDEQAPEKAHARAAAGPGATAVAADRPALPASGMQARSQPFRPEAAAAQAAELGGVEHACEHGTAATASLDGGCEAGLAPPSSPAAKRARTCAASTPVQDVPLTAQIVSDIESVDGSAELTVAEGVREAHAHGLPQLAAWLVASARAQAAAVQQLGTERAERARERSEHQRVRDELERLRARVQRVTAELRF